MNAKEFLKAMVKGDRSSQIAAIDAYVGYDHSQSFGAQETMARMKASREIKGYSNLTVMTAPSRSVAGYVAGMPNYKAKELANLKARVNVTVNAMLDYEKAGKLELAAIEKERLGNLNKDIAALR